MSNRSGMLNCKPTYGSSSETTYAMLGIGGSVNFPVQVLSSHALLQERSSQDGSRRMLFPMKTDNFIRCKKKRGETIKIGATVARPLHIESIEKDMVSNVSGADCYNVLSGCFFSESSPSACILVTKSFFF